MRLARQRLLLRAARASRQSCGTLLQVGYAPLEEFVFLKRLTMSGPLRELESEPLQFIPDRPGHPLARRVLGVDLGGVRGIDQILIQLLRGRLQVGRIAKGCKAIHPLQAFGAHLPSRLKSELQVMGISFASAVVEHDQAEFGLNVFERCGSARASRITIEWVGAVRRNPVSPHVNEDAAVRHGIGPIDHVGATAATRDAPATGGWLVEINPKRGDRAFSDVSYLDMNTCFVRNRCNVVESRRGNSGRLELGGGGARDGKKTTHEAQPMSCTHGETSIPETGC